MENEKKALFDSVMLDAADSERFEADLTSIAAMIDRAARSIEGLGAAEPPKPDAAWLAMVPESDPVQTPDGAADVVTVRHDIVSDDRTRPANTLTVPRIVAG